MPHAVTHFLIPAMLVALFRDALSKKKKRTFPLHYVLIAGLGGLLLDLDYILQFLLQTQNHRIFFHNIFIPAIFLILALIFAYTKLNNPELGKHKLHLSTIFYILAFSTTIHLLLDATIQGTIIPFYPIAIFTLGANLVQHAPQIMQDSIVPILDAILLTVWIIYMEVKHKISNFI